MTQEKDLLLGESGERVSDRFLCPGDEFLVPKKNDIKKIFPQRARHVGVKVNRRHLREVVFAAMGAELADAEIERAVEAGKKSRFGVELL